MDKIPLTEGRRLFGNDPAAYANARPDYPDELYNRLTVRCGLRPGAAVFEIGAGTGIATRRLLAMGASPLHAIEPDLRLSEFLRESIPSDALAIDQTSFEEAVLKPATFDLGVAATSFHWLEQTSALAKVYQAVKPGGWWAMWWNCFGPEQPDAFRSATDHLFVGTADSPFIGRKDRPPFALDQQQRLADLTAAGFLAPEVDIWHWDITYDTVGLVNLYSTFSPIQVLEPEARRRFLSNLAEIIQDQFGGRVERPFTTVLYSARRL